METKTINKNNWSGEQVTYKTDGERITLKGFKLLLKKVELKDIGEVMYKVFWDYSDNKGEPKNHLCNIYNFRGDWFAEEMGVSRENKSKEVVAIEMFFNLV